jgi:hypothetical protein
MRACRCGYFKSSRKIDDCVFGVSIPAMSGVSALATASTASTSLFTSIVALRAMVRPHSSPLVWFTVLCALPALVSAHIIHVAAAQKDCFFEDLHVNDKVLPATGV